MVHHWISNNVKQSGYDDMVLLTKITEDAIYDNIKKRFIDNYIYTYIGPVLISINPYKELAYFTDKEVEMYTGATQIENPPHIYALSDFMYRNMLIDAESQCVIISGESGAGKTVCAKYIMSYISKVSGGNNSEKVQHVKNIILQSNPLLEAFGNAKTLRNNNSSRFGKYVEIQFSRSGEPNGGRITNFLLEKSRVIGQIKKERNFHIFYQLCSFRDEALLKRLGIQNASRFNYLSKSECFSVEGIDDSKDFSEVLEAMKTINLSEAEQFSIFQIIAGVLHLGNISFNSNGNYAKVEHDQFLEYPSHLLGISKEALRTKLVSRTIETKASSQQERIDVSLNVEQAEYTRDALAKGLYSRLFDYLVTHINSAMEAKSDQLLNISILDIYGFEIFNQNGFEQFCINYVNEKLQQIFIELTLKAEQEEYKQEGIKWTNINFFNNKIVCDLIESKTSPPGIFSISDDVVKTIHATGDGVDTQLLLKLKQSYSGHPHFGSNSDGFIIRHYAGDVDYKIDGFCEKNRDVLFQDLIDLMKASDQRFIQNLFTDVATGQMGRIPTTAGKKITTQANQLVDKLMKCYPSYIRCIKPNETKRPKDIDEERVKHQIKYLGLVENVRVRRAGFAYRREFEKFIKRYGIINKQTMFWIGDSTEGIKIIMKTVNITNEQFQMGKTKVFIKAPESLFLLEELRDRKYNEYALVLQKAFRKFNAIQYFLKLKNEAADLLYEKKERRALSVNRKFYADYIGLDSRPDVRLLIQKRETVEFAQSVWKYDRQFRKQRRDLVLTNKAFYLIGRELFKDKNTRNKKMQVVLKRRLEYAQVARIALSHFQDNFLIIFPVDDYATILEVEFKTEFLTTFSKRYKEAFNKWLNIEFNDQIVYQIKKEGWSGGSSRTAKFSKDTQLRDVQIIAPKITGKVCEIRVPNGLPNTTRPTAQYYQKYNFESEPWWPKFDRLRSKFGITIVKGDKLHKSRDQTRSQPKFKSNNATNGSSLGSNQVGIGVEGSINSKGSQQQSGFNNMNASSGASFNSEAIKPPIKKRKPPAPEPNYPKCTALYEYNAADSDELSFKAGDILYIVKEDPSGWWNGICKGKAGLFPSNYVEKN